MSYYPNNFYQNYQPQGLQGKVVENQDIVKISEIPFGSYGIFPKSDLNEIYVKTWNNNGTTSVVTYRPIEESSTQEPTTEMIMLEKMKVIEEKINSLTEKQEQKKEVKLNNDY